MTAITADAQRNVDFYVGVLGLRLVKKTVNQDNPTVYHLFYADEKGDPGSDLTFFEYPGIPAGRAGDGMVHRIVWRVGSTDALEFWAGRLGERGVETQRADGRLRFADPEGLDHELLVPEVGDEPLTADHPEIPAEFALQGFDGVRAYASDPDRSAELLAETLRVRPRHGEAKKCFLGGEGGEARRRSTPTTSRLPRPACRAPAASITSPGRRPSRSTRPGATGSSRPG